MNRTSIQAGVGPGRSRGFSLLELLVVSVILGLLVGYVAPRFFGQVGKSEVKVAKAQIRAMEDALDQYRLDVGRYPITERSDTWELVPPPDGEAGVYDIRSGAEGDATDGQAYRDW